MFRWPRVRIISRTTVCEVDLRPCLTIDAVEFESRHGRSVLGCPVDSAIVEEDMSRSREERIHCSITLNLPLPQRIHRPGCRDRRLR